MLLVLCQTLPESYKSIKLLTIFFLGLFTIHTFDANISSRKRKSRCRDWNARVRKLLWFCRSMLFDERTVKSCWAIKTRNRYDNVTLSFYSLLKLTHLFIIYSTMPYIWTYWSPGKRLSRLHWKWSRWWRNHSQYVFQNIGRCRCQQKWCIFCLNELFWEKICFSTTK